MKVLITGGAGFVGSHLTDRLLAEDHDVLVIDNYRTGRRDNLQAHDRLRVVEDTIADADLVARQFEAFQPTHVVHAAASYHDPGDWEEDVRTNVVGTINVLRATEAVGVERLIYYETALRYGLVPMEQPITLTHPTVAGGSSYAISKTGGEQYIQMSSVDHIIFVLANAYGPRNISGPLPTFFQRLTTGKPCFVMDTRRDFIYIADLVDITMRALAGKGETGAYHVSSGSDYAIKELFDATVAALDIQLDEEVEVRERSADDVYTILLDPAKTERDFDWKISTPLAQGIREAVAYYREHGITETFTHLKHDE
jgi:UDP-glucose 4-epimerase